MAGLTRILVVEDDPEVRGAIKTVLEAEAYAVVESGDGADALTKLRASPRPSLILLDLMMPGMNGWQFMDEVRVQSRSAPGPYRGRVRVWERARNAARRGRPSRSGGASGGLRDPPPERHPRVV